MSQRLEYIDHLKAVAITLVVFGHFLIAINPIRFSYHPVQIVYSFHMPLFFFLSGFMVGFKDNGKLPFSFIKKKMATLLLPWLSWTMISACYLGGGVITASIWTYYSFIHSTDIGFFQFCLY